MSEQHPPEGEPVVEAEVYVQLPPTPQGTYQYGRSDGTFVHGDARGEWTLDADGELEDIVFFASPRWVGHGRRPGPRVTTDVDRIEARKAGAD
jgi:hypothetical protein